MTGRNAREPRPAITPTDAGKPIPSDPAPATQGDPEREPPTDWAAVAIVAAGWLASALAIVAWALFKSGVLR